MQKYKITAVSATDTEQVLTPAEVGELIMASRAHGYAVETSDEGLIFTSSSHGVKIVYTVA